MRKHVKSLVGLIQEVVEKPSLGAEIGVWRGHTSQALLGLFPVLRLYCVDPWYLGGDQGTMGDDGKGHKLREAYEEFVRRTNPTADRRLILQAESVEAATHVTEASLDFCFIDACHYYDAVAADVRAWAPKVRPGGLLAGHDYGGAGDRRGWFGVKRAVDEWSVKTGLIIRTRPGLIWWVVIPK